jgi:mannose-6-phosphate isomerase-like protein (cupin superfamily)
MVSAQAGLFVGPADGQVIPNPIGGRMVVKVRDADTDGAYSIHDNVLPPHSPGPRPHRHYHHDEVFYVLEGTLTVRVGAQTFTAPPGSFVIVPRGVVHQPLNPTPDPVRVLLVFSPAGMDRFFAEAADRRLPLQTVPTDPDVLADLDEFTTRYGYEFAEFPSDADD